MDLSLKNRFMTRLKTYQVTTGTQQNVDGPSRKQDINAESGVKS